MTKNIYLAGWEERFYGIQRFNDFIESQISSKEIAMSVYCSIELVYEDNKLIKAYNCVMGEKSNRELDVEELGLEYPNYQQNKLLDFSEGLNGEHVLGGETPNDFQLPNNNCKVSFQYLGFINNKDPYFQWLPFKVHLTCPIYLNFNKLFLDYSDSCKPTIINKDEIESGQAIHNELDSDFEIVYEDMKFGFIESNKLGLIGNSGIPMWIQSFDIPYCPKTGKKMKFLCQFSGGIDVVRTNAKIKDEWLRKDYQKLNFYGSGDLFVFFEPTSKVACYFIQNT